jgi:hypothetical protein
VSGLFELARHLTERDWEVALYLYRHRVLTTKIAAPSSRSVLLTTRNCGEDAGRRLTADSTVAYGSSSRSRGMSQTTRRSRGPRTRAIVSEWRAAAPDSIQYPRG